ncbi:MAG: vitamin K epoxide reductase family protein [Bythopirellula sp.]|nr:vitamin K epoxide reductase family protein [Bythopirellula sp.]
MIDLSHLPGTRKWLAVAITVLALAALSVSSYLTWVTWQQSTVAGCTGGSTVDCDEVLSSAGSKWLGIPVSLFGALTYASILALVWPAVLVGGWAMTGLLSLAMLAAGAGVWFVGTQALVVQHFCLYCLAVHTCGLLICTAAFYLIRGAASEPNYDHMQAFFGGGEGTTSGALQSDVYQPLIAAGVASLGLVALIGGQVFFAPASMEVLEVVPLEVVEAPVASTEETPAAESASAENELTEPAADPVIVTDESDQELFADETVPDEESPPEKFEIVAGGDPPTSGESVDLASGDAPRFFRFKYLGREIDAAGNPVIGNPYAPRRFVEMMDYTCPHCRKLHPFIKSAVERYGDQLGFVIYHVPLSRKCNQLVKVDQASHQNACDYARLAYGVWKLAPEKFAEYHEWLLEGERTPALYAAKKKAMELVGDEILLDKSIATESNRRVGESAAELEPLKIGLPVLIFEGGVVRGLPATEAEWFKMLEERVGVKAP